MPWLVDLDAEVLHDLGVFLVVAADQRREFARRKDIGIQAAGAIEALLHIPRFERAPDFGAQALQHRLWQSRRREHAEPDAVLESRVELADRRQLGILPSACCPTPPARA